MSRRIVVTGGGTGLGRAIAVRLAAESPDLVLVGRRTTPLEETAAAVRARSEDAQVTTVSCDLRDPDAVQELADDLRAGPPVDVLVLNAGGNFGGEGEGLAAVADEWRQNFESNVLTTVLLAEAISDHLARPGGRVVSLSSVAGLRGSGAYGAAKSAINNWTWWQANRLGPDGITVNAVAPGFVPDTEFWTDRIAADPDLPAKRSADIPLGRPGTPDEVAEAVAYLVAPEAGWTTGQVLGVNGGVVISR